MCSSLPRSKLADLPLSVIPDGVVFHNKLLFRRLHESPTQLHGITNRIPMTIRTGIERKLSKYVLRCGIDWEQGMVLRIKHSPSGKRTYRVWFHLWKSLSVESTAGCIISAVEVCRDEEYDGAVRWWKIVGAEGSGVCYNYPDRVVLYSYMPRGECIQRSYVVHFRRGRHSKT